MFLGGQIQIEISIIGRFREVVRIVCAKVHRVSLLVDHIKLAP